MSANVKRLKSYCYKRHLHATHPHAHRRTAIPAIEDLQVAACALVFQCTSMRVYICIYIAMNVAISNNLSRLTATSSSVYKKI